jgi:hypothetical protein
MKIHIGLLVTAGIFCGCGMKGGSEYIGKWVHVKYSNHSLDIERNGESFIVRDSHPSFLDGKPETKNIPATYKDGMLYMATGFGNVSLVIDKASGNLTDGKTEFKKIE